MHGHANLRRLLISLVGVLAAVVLTTATGCGALPLIAPPTATPTATPSPTPTATSTPTATATPTPTATPTATPAPLTLSLRLEPEVVPQGQIGTLIVEPSEPVTVSATLAGKPLALFPRGGRWYGLIGIWAGTRPASWSLVVTATDPHSGIPVAEERSLRIGAREFEIERVDMEDSTLSLVLDTDALAKENSLIAGVVSQRSPQQLWEGRFMLPVQGEVSSTYGLLRSYNGGPPTDQHGGLDLAADEGVPVAAANAGRVVLASRLKVRGNIVIIDHGWGLFTGYYHLSALEVEAGQYVQQGQTIGRVGSTGFSTGPHLHWAAWVGGSLVDPVQLLEWQLPE